MTHLLRPGPIWGTQALCEKSHRSDMVAELSPRGLEDVDCRDCLFILRQLKMLMDLHAVWNPNDKPKKLVL